MISISKKRWCHKQIAMSARQHGLDLEVMHPVQLLDAAHRASEQYTVPENIASTRQRQTLFLGMGDGIVGAAVASLAKLDMLGEMSSICSAI